MSLPYVHKAATLCKKIEKSYERILRSSSNGRTDERTNESEFKKEVFKLIKQFVKRSQIYIYCRPNCTNKNDSDFRITLHTNSSRLQVYFSPKNTLKKLEHIE